MKDDKTLNNADIALVDSYTDQILARNEQILTLLKQSHQGAMIRSRALYLKKQERPSRYFKKGDPK